MDMKLYAHVADGRVVELLGTTSDISAMFYPNLVWIDVTDAAGIACGWRYDGSRFTEPDAIAAERPSE